MYFHKSAKSWLLFLAVCIVAYEAWYILSQRTELAEARGAVESGLRENASSRERIRTIEEELAKAATRETRPAISNTAALSNEQPQIEDELDSWISRVSTLRNFGNAHPELLIPEMKYLDISDWLDATKKGTLTTEAEMRVALAALRYSAKTAVAPKISEALRAYLSQNNGVLPGNSLILSTYGSEPMSADILARYKVNPSGILEGITGDKWILIEAAPPDTLWDSLLFFGATGGVAMKSVDTTKLQAVNAAVKQFRIKTGALPVTETQIAPFLASSIDRNTLAEIFRATLSPVVKGTPNN